MLREETTEEGRSVETKYKVSLEDSSEYTRPNNHTLAPCSIACWPPVQRPCTNLAATRHALAARPPPTHPAAAYPALPTIPSEIDTARLSLGPLPATSQFLTACS